MKTKKGLKKLRAPTPVAVAPAPSSDERTVQLVSVQLTATASKPTWIQIAKSGSFRGHTAGAFELNEGVFAEIVRNFNATQNRRVPIDYEHESERDTIDPSVGAPAQGWIVDLKIEAGNLWGLVEWVSETAIKQIRSKQYMFLSPAVVFGSKDPVTGERIGARLSSAAITNHPFLDGMQPLAATNKPASTSGERPPDAMLLRDALRTATVARVKARRASKRTEELEAEVARLRAQLGERDERAIDEQVAAVATQHGFSAAQAAGLRTMAQRDPAGFVQAFGSPPPPALAYLSATIAAGRNNEQPAAMSIGGITGGEEQAVRMTGRGRRPSIADEVPSHAELVAKYQAKGCTLEEAVVRAHDKITKAVARLRDRQGSVR